MIQQATTAVRAIRKVGVPKNRANASARLANQPSAKTEDAEANGRFNRKNSSRYFRSNSASMVSSVRHYSSDMIASLEPSRAKALTACGPELTGPKGAMPTVWVFAPWVTPTRSIALRIACQF